MKKRALLYETGVKMAEGAALMTDTKMSYRILGAAYPRHFNPCAKGRSKALVQGSDV